MKILLAVLALVWAATANAGQVVQPPGPIAAPACGGGNSNLGYTAYGSPLTCGTALSSGSIANGATQLGVYVGLNAIGPLTGVNNGVLTFNGSGVPTPSITLPSGLTIPGFAPLASPTFTGTPLAPTPSAADNTTKIATTAYVQAQGYASTTAPTISAPVLSGAVTLSGLTNAPLLGTDTAGALRSITLGSNLSLSGTTLNASGGASGNVTWPAAASLVVSNSTNSPSGLAPVNNALVYGSGSAWLALPPVTNSIPCVNSATVLTMCSPSTVQGVLGYLTTNQSIVLGGDATGVGNTAITVTNSKVNGVSYPASPLTNTIPFVSSSNQVSYGNAASILSILGTPFLVANGGTGLTTLTSGALYKGNGTGAPLPSGLSDNGSMISTSETFDLTNQSVVVEIPNASSGGTTNGLLAKLTGAPSTAVTVLTTDTDGALGLVLNGGGTTGNAQIVIGGQANCAFDGATTANDWVVISSTVAGKCHDTGSTTRPGGLQVIGRTLTTNGSAGSFSMIFIPQFTNTAGSAPTWPTSGKIVVSNGTNTPAGIAEVDGQCIIGSGGNWVAGSCISGGGVTSAGTSTVNNIPFWTGTGTLSNVGVPFGTTGNNTLAETLGTGLLSNAIINWGAPSAIGNTTAAAGSFTTLSASSTVSGTGFSTYLAAPPAIGGTTPAAGAFTTLSASGAVSGTGFSNYLASPPAIGGTSAGAGSFTTLSASSTVSGAGFSTYLLSPPAIGTTAPAAGKFTTLAATGAITATGLSTGTQVSCLGLNASNVVVLAAAACGSGGGTSIDTGTTGISAGGTTLGTATDLTTQQSYVSAGANCTTLANGCAGTAAVRFDAALMVAFNHLYVCNEDSTNALLVYPDTTAHFINNQAAGVGIPVQANQCGHFIVKSATTLRTVP